MIARRLEHDVGRLERRGRVVERQRARHRELRRRREIEGVRGADTPRISVNPAAESVLGTSSTFHVAGGAARGRHVPATQAAPPPH